MSAAEKSGSEQRRKSKGGSILPTLCRIIGELIIIILVLLSLAIVGPRVAGYSVYSVLGNTMEPEIPMGSAVYCRKDDPAELESGDVIAFSAEGGVTIQRVLENYPEERYCTAKDDMDPNPEDAAEDVFEESLLEDKIINEIPYEVISGTVIYHVPVLGELIVLISSGIGMVCLICLLGCGLVLLALGVRMEEEQRTRMKYIRELEDRLK